jgi:hypothetical protein
MGVKERDLDEQHEWHGKPFQLPSYDYLSHVDAPTQDTDTDRDTDG